MNPDCNYLENIEATTFKLFRKSVISNILNTDMSKHFDLLKKFDKKILKLEKN